MGQILLYTSLIVISVFVMYVSVETKRNKKETGDYDAMSISKFFSSILLSVIVILSSIFQLIKLVIEIL